MTRVAKSRFKPRFKKLVKLRENVLSSEKLSKLKKVKWKNLVKYHERKLRSYKKYKPYDHNLCVVSKYPSRGTSYKKKLHDLLYVIKIFRLIYGNVPKRSLKNILKKTLKHMNIRKITLNSCFLSSFENRLCFVLYRAKFTKSLREAQQIVLHGKVLVNDQTVTSKTYSVKMGDIISIRLEDMQLIRKNLQNLHKDNLPMKSFLINYKTLQIFCNNTTHMNTSLFFPFYLNIAIMLVNSKRY